MKAQGAGSGKTLMTSLQTVLHQNGMLQVQFSLAYEKKRAPI